MPLNDVVLNFVQQRWIVGAFSLFACSLFQEMAEDRHMRRPTSDTTDALRVVYANGNVVVMIRGAEPECHNAAHVDVLSELVRDCSC